MTSLGWNAEGTVAAGRHRISSAVAGLRSTLREAPRRQTRIAFFVCIGSLLLYWGMRHLVGVSMVDMVVYRAEGSAVANGHDLYSLRVTQWNLPATYPPFAAMLFVPTSWAPVSVLRVIVTLGNLGLLGAFGYLSAVLAGWPRRAMRPALVMLVVGLGVWLEPVFTTFRYGQINLLIGVLVLYDFTRPDSSRWKGITLGLAAGIKLTPGLFVVYLLLSGRIRSGVTAAATCLGTMVLGQLILPDASVNFWTKYVFDTSRVGKEYIVDNQSLRGMVERAVGSPEPGAIALVITAVVAVVGMAVAVGLHRHAVGFPRARAWSVLCVAVTAVLVSPISWTHHWVWCVPMLVLLAAEASQERVRAGARRRATGTRGRRPWRAVLIATGVAFSSYVMWAVPHHELTNLTIPFYLQPFAALYPLLGLAFLALAGVRLRRRLRRTDGVGSPAEAISRNAPEPENNTAASRGALAG